MQRLQTLNRPASLRAVAVAVLLLVSACGDASEPEAGPRVIASTSIIGDVVQNIVGEDVEVVVMVPRGADPHSYQASARQAAALAEADLVIINGLGLEEALEDVISSAIHDGATVLEVGPHLNPLPITTQELGLDPHVWMDPIRMADAVTLIGATFEANLPGGGWKERAAAYRQDVERVAAQAGDVVMAIPAERRKLVTNHNSLSYFADRYGFEVVGVVIPGGSSVASPSAADIAELVAVIKDEGTPALFTDSGVPSSVAEAIAAEFGGALTLVKLYSGSLGPPGSGAETYLELIATHAALIADALGGD